MSHNLPSRIQKRASLISIKYYTLIIYMWVYLLNENRGLYDWVNITVQKCRNGLSEKRIFEVGNCLFSCKLCSQFDMFIFYL